MFIVRVSRDYVHMSVFTVLKRTNDERGVLPPIRGSLSPPPGMGKIISDERPLPALVGKSVD